MTTITVYGSGCAKCRQVEALIQRVVNEDGLSAEVRKVSDLQEIVRAGVLSTPAVAVNGVVKASGRIPRVDEVQAWIANVSNIG